MEGLSSWIVIPAAFVMDMLLGDPRRFPHPVRWMGRAIVSAEPWFRRLPIHPVLSGGAFAAFLVAVLLLSLMWVSALVYGVGWVAREVDDAAVTCCPSLAGAAASERPPPGPRCGPIAAPPAACRRRLAGPPPLIGIALDQQASGLLDSREQLRRRVEHQHVEEGG